MKNVIVGTAGHVDHGKTCLIKALTGIDADRLKEEKQRGITIELGFADMQAPDGTDIGIIDVPGHEKFIRNMLAGIGGIDLVLLVVAADEGVMPQTVEHLDIMRLLNIRRGIIVITKADMVEEVAAGMPAGDWLDMIESDVRKAVQGTFLEDAPCLRVSAQTGEGIEELKQLIFSEASKVGDKNNNPSLLRIPMDRVFTIQGFGTVVTGTLTQGMIRTGDEVTIYPEGLTAKVRGLQVHGRPVEAAYAGQRTAVNLAGIKKEDIARGNVLAAKDSLHPASMIDVKLTDLADSHRTILNGSRLHLHYGSAEVLCKAVLLDRDALDPGSSCYAQLRTEEPVALKAGDPFVVRYYSPLETIGGGIVLNADARKHKRGDEAVLQALAVREKGDGTAQMEQILKDESHRFPGFESLAAQLGLSEEQGAEQLKSLAAQGKAVVLHDNIYIHQNYVNQIRDASFEILDNYYEKNPLLSSMPREELRSKLAGALKVKDLRNLDRVLQYLGDTGILALTPSAAGKAGYTVRYTKTQLRLMDEIADLYARAGCESPDPDEIFAGRKDKEECKRLIAAMCADGRLTRISGKFCLDSAVLQETIAWLRDKIGTDGSVTLAELRDRLNTSRKYALMILEYCDNIKITRLQGDCRVFY
ncbi:MAG: selenocysteine-specific translation elongation factor [Firmicutes bacterium]|nr:selenocysteine-specific translation elongation factor [Bacillota bacterium]